MSVCYGLETFASIKRLSKLSIVVMEIQRGTKVTGHMIFYKARSGALWASPYVTVKFPMSVASTYF